MMKKPKYYLFAFAVAICLGLSSCSKPENIIVKQDGIWSVETLLIRMEDGVEVSRESNENFGIMTFNEDGTGTFNPENGSEETFAWEVDDDVMIFTEANNNVSEFEIVEANQNYVVFYSETEENISGINESTQFTLILDQYN